VPETIAAGARSGALPRFRELCVGRIERADGWAQMRDAPPTARRAGAPWIVAAAKSSLCRQRCRGITRAFARRP
jgi:hypothetical protein